LGQWPSRLAENGGPADIARNDDAAGSWPVAITGFRHHHSRRCSSIAGDGDAGSGVLIASAAIIA
jgi:hypothetical protein